MSGDGGHIIVKQMRGELAVKRVALSGRAYPASGVDFVQPSPHAAGMSPLPNRPLTAASEPAPKIPKPASAAPLPIVARKCRREERCGFKIVCRRALLFHQPASTYALFSYPLPTQEVKFQSKGIVKRKIVSKTNKFDVHSNPSYRDFQVSFEKLPLSILKK